MLTVSQDLPRGIKFILLHDTSCQNNNSPTQKFRSHRKFVKLINYVFAVRNNKLYIIIQLTLGSDSGFLDCYAEEGGYCLQTFRRNITPSSWMVEKSLKDVKNGRHVFLDSWTQMTRIFRPDERNFQNQTVRKLKSHIWLEYFFFS